MYSLLSMPICFAVITFIFLAIRRHQRRKVADQVARSVVVEGVVVERRSTTDTDGANTGYRITVEYRDAHGAVHRVHSRRPSHSYPVEGQRMRVVCNPHGAADARIEADMLQGANVMTVLAGVFGGVTALMVVGGVLLFVFYREEMAEDFAYELADTETPPGDHKAYRPFAHVDEVGAFAGPSAKLVTIEAVGVSSNGTVELGGDNGRAHVELHFHARQTARDKREWKFRTDFVDVAVTVRNPRKVRISSGDSRNAVTKLNKGMERLPSPISGPLRRRTQYPPAPKCSAAELWKTAIEHGAPPALPAVIEYDRSGYRFRNGAIPTDFTLAFGHDCKPVEG